MSTSMLNSSIESTTHHSEDGEWALNVRNLERDKLVVEKFDFVLNAWHLPQYPGLADHKGILRHSSHWDPTSDPTGKRWP